MVDPIPLLCPLPFNDKVVVRNTAYDGEIPCYGCPKKKGCKARVDREMSAALILMREKPPETRKCRRCGDAVIPWVVSGTFRIFTCGGFLKNDDGSSTEIPCGWTISELGETS